MMMADPSWQDLQKTRPKETEDFHKLWLAAQGERGMVRRPEYSRYEKWLEGQKKIPKKGMGGLIDSPLYLRDY